MAFKKTVLLILISALLAGEAAAWGIEVSEAFVRELYSQTEGCGEEYRGVAHEPIMRCWGSVEKQAGELRLETIVKARKTKAGVLFSVSLEMRPLYGNLPESFFDIDTLNIRWEDHWSEGGPTGWLVVWPSAGIASKSILNWVNEHKLVRAPWDPSTPLETP